MTDSNPKFSTARTRELRATDLKPEDERTVSHIENFGCSVVHVKPTKQNFGWSYTIGIFDTCGQPELIAVGLPEKTAHFLLNEAAKLLRKGVDRTSSESDRKRGLRISSRRSEVGQSRYELGHLVLP